MKKNEWVDSGLMPARNCSPTPKVKPPKGATIDRTELKPGEFHPSTHIAMNYIKANLCSLIRECIASEALSGDRVSEVAFGTIQRLDNKEPVSDRYVMGLALLIYSAKEAINDDLQKGSA